MGGCIGGRGKRGEKNVDGVVGWDFERVGLYDALWWEMVWDGW